MLFMKLGCAIFAKNGGGGVQFCANNGKLPVDRGDAVMIQLVTSKERNLSRLWDSSVCNRQLFFEGFSFIGVWCPELPLNCSDILRSGNEWNADARVIQQ